jgi:hypothetical protein
MAASREVMRNASSEPAREPTFAEQFERDFRLGLPLGAGRPHSSDPLQILTDDPAMAANAAAAVVAAIHAANGRLWKLFGLAWEEVNGRPLLCVSTDVVEGATREGLEMAAAAFFFDPVRLAPSPDVAWPSPGRTVPGCGLPVPFELGWLHLLRTVDHESARRGAGYGYEYSAPGVTGTLYVYDDGHDLTQATVETPAVRQAAEDARAEVLGFHRDAAMGEVTPWADPEHGLAPVLYSVGRLADGMKTLLLLAVARSRLVKLRLTFDPDVPRLVLDESVQEFRLLVSGGARPS